MNIRLYKKEEYPMIREWWMGHKKEAPAENMFPEDSTYIVENDKGEPWVCIAMYLTNCPGFCFIEGTVSNPFISRKGLGKALKALNIFLSDVAKQKGYSSIIGLVDDPGMRMFARLNKDMGFKEVIPNTSVFLKVL